MQILLGNHNSLILGGKISEYELIVKYGHVDGKSHGPRVAGIQFNRILYRKDFFKITLQGTGVWYGILVMDLKGAK